MHSNLASASLLGLSCLSSLVAAAPFAYPLSNGFPTVADPSAIEIQAQGTLPNGPPPPAIAADTATSLRLIAFNELFEVAYFTSLLSNITNSVAGFAIPDYCERQTVTKALTAIVAQEELHALNANGALDHFNLGPIQPCQYQFPTTSLQDAIALASTFTDVVLGTLQDVQGHLGSDGDIGLIRPVGSVIGQEGEQNGFFRFMQGKIPSALPFLTTSTREFAFSALNQNFIVPGSCPNSNTIALPVFGALTVATPQVNASDATLQFSVTANSTAQFATPSALSLVYINQQNTPIVEPLSNVQVNGNAVSFSANFPYSANEMNGLTIAAVVRGSGPFDSAAAVANATLFGPGLIEIN